jgi:hypothetical protein
MKSYRIIRSLRGSAALALLAIVAAACGPSGSSAEGPDQGGPAAGADDAAQAGVVTVYKSPTCGCCAKWVDHLRESGYQVEVRDTADVQPVKTAHGLPGHLASCHTALVGGYVVEGHVPADVIRRLLRERPAVAGIAVPGMPGGSPGMEGPRKDPYDVIAFTRDGSTSVYESR